MEEVWICRGDVRLFVMYAYAMLGEDPLKVACSMRETKSGLSGSKVR